ncbi:MAG TPA: tripartite tricarboxylate transporter substrate binding protein [Burkholderiaceae bacterium]|jgi:tripartite-type tricarboxylate transporter receptor subunit TctC
MPSPDLTRRATLGAALLAALHVGAARAQSSRQLRLIVPYSAGGTADALPRIVVEKLAASYPGGAIVDNRPGAGGNIGGDEVFRAKPDGFTLLASPPGPIAINQSLYPKMTFDPAKWVPVTVLASVPNVLVVSPQVPAKDFRELLAWIRSRPGKVTFASQGNGTTSHLTASLFMMLTGTEMVHVPYKGTAPALIDLMGGQVDIFFDNLSSSMSQHRAGKVRILAVADDHRSPLLESIPTFAELGLPKMSAVTWFALMAPPGTPQATADAIQRAVAGVLKLQDVQRRFAEQGAEPLAYTPTQTAAFVKSEAEKWANVIKISHVSIE